MVNTPVINSFNAGELSPYLYARNDLKKYNSGCLVLENFQALPYGGAVRRPAIKWIGEAKDGENVNLIEFEFSSELTYLLEFGDKYIRFIKDGVYLTVAYTAWLTTTVYAIGDLVTETAIHYRCLEAHTAGIFATDLGDGKWEVSGGATDTAYEIPSPYDIADVHQLRVMQSADVMWIVERGYFVQKLSRFGDTNWTIGEETYIFPVFRDQNVTLNTLECDVTDKDDTGVLTSSVNLFDANHVGSYWQLKHARSSIALSDFNVSAGATPPEPVDTSDSMLASAGVRVAFYTKGTWSAGAQVVIWRSDDDGVSWQQERFYDMNGRNVDTSWTETNPDTLYTLTSTAATGGTFTFTIDEAFNTGVVKVTNFTDAQNVDIVVIRTLGSTDTTTRWSEGAWSTFRGFPQAVALWESRLIFASTISDPNTMWLSTIDDFNNFNQTTLDDGAMTETLGSGRLDEIRWLVPQQALIIGTAGSEWVLEGESDNKTVSSSSKSLKRKTTYGSNSSVQGVVVNSAVLFVMRQGRKIREFIYNFDTADYVAPDMTILAEHITEGGVVDAVYQQQPDNTLLCIREDGTMIPMTYERDQDVTGWQRWVNEEFTFESVAVLPRDNDEDAIYVSCKITVDGVVKRYIGLLDNREWGTDVATEWNGSDFYTVFGPLDQDGWITVSGENSTDSDFNQDYLYNTSLTKWEGITDNAVTLEKTTDWAMTDGSITYSAPDNSEVTPPLLFILNSESSDASEAGLNGSVEWYDSGIDLNGQDVLYNFSDTYAKWFDGTEWFITIIADVDGSPTNSFKQDDFPDTISISGTGTAADGDYDFIGMLNGKVRYEHESVTSFIEWNGSNWRVTGTPDEWTHPTSTATLPPKSGWGIGEISASPAPTLAYSGSDLFVGQGAWTGTIAHEEDPYFYIKSTTNTISGLEIYEGKTVDIVRDGMVEPQKTVVGGQIEVQKTGLRIVVGLPYISTMAPMFIEPPGQFEQPMGKHKAIFKAVIRFKDTIEAQVGNRLDNLETVKFRTTNDPLDAQIDLFSGEKKINFENIYELLHTCYVVQDKPLPITVIAMISWLNVHK